MEPLLGLSLLGLLTLQLLILLLLLLRHDHELMLAKGRGSGESRSKLRRERCLKGQLVGRGQGGHRAGRRGHAGHRHVGIV